MRAGHVNAARYCTTVLHAKHADRILFFLNLSYSLYLTDSVLLPVGVWGEDVVSILGNHEQPIVVVQTLVLLGYLCTRLSVHASSHGSSPSYIEIDLKI